MADEASLRLGAALRDPQGLADHGPEPTEIDRLGDEVEGTGLERLDGGLHAAVGGDHRHGGTRGRLLDVRDQRDAIAVRQAQIGQAQIERIALQELLGLGQAHGPARADLKA
jgi:hypothetical protein